MRMGKNEIKEISWLIMFGILFLTPFITFPVIKKISGSHTETRENVEFPKVSLKNYKEYPKLFEQWFEDTLPYKDILIRTNGKIAFWGFGESASENVIVGKEGWLFYTETMSDYKRINLYTQKELEEICKKQKQLQDYYQSKGIEYILFVAPNKASIYGEDYLPDYIYKEDSVSRLEQLVEYIRRNSNITVVFPEEELLSVKEKYPEYSLYMHVDTHWNNLGGYCGAKALLKELGMKLPEIDEIHIEKNANPVFTWNGWDLANMMGLTGVLEEDTNYEISGFTDNIVVWDGDTVNSYDSFVTYCRTKSSDPVDRRKVIFIRDSFGTPMLPFIASQFREVYSPYVSFEVDLEEEKPDLVIYELVERNFETK